MAIIEMPETQDVPVIVVGAGPAGLMAAEQLASAGFGVHVYDAMPSPGRKFLRAGIGGLNLTHAEPFQYFLDRYSDPHGLLPWLQTFDANAMRDWAQSLGIETFVGSSGRVFPVGLKAAPLLRAWLHRLREQDVILHTRRRWLGMTNEPAHGTQLHSFEGPDGLASIRSSVAILAMGGGSWARLGSDGRWCQPLTSLGIECTPLRPANCGFEYTWSALLLERYVGTPVKSVALSIFSGNTEVFCRRGEALISEYGVEGSLIYAASRFIREQIEHAGEATVYWDLLPDHSCAQIESALRNGKSKESLSNRLRKRLRLDGSRLGLFYELRGTAGRDVVELSGLLKKLPQSFHNVRPIDEAISTAGGVCLGALDEALMSRRVPGLFCAGEMLDWEAPTGGYLLNACFASGVIAGRGAVSYLRRI